MVYILMYNLLLYPYGHTSKIGKIERTPLYSTFKYRLVEAQLKLGFLSDPTSLDHN